MLRCALCSHRGEGQSASEAETKRADSPSSDSHSDHDKPDAAGAARVAEPSTTEPPVSQADVGDKTAEPGKVRPRPSDEAGPSP